MFHQRHATNTRENHGEAAPSADAPKPALRGAGGARRGLRDITNKSGSSAGTRDTSAKAMEIAVDPEPVAAATAPCAAAPAVRSSAGSLGRASSTSLTTACAPVAAARRVDDIDARDKDNVLAVTDYVQDMFTYFREREYHTGISPNYMRQQVHINEQMRAILVDWLVEVHLKFKLYPETLHLTVSLIDRYLELKTVTRNRLQLVGVTCLLLASKYEEIYPPELRDLVYMTDRAYTKEEILEMETTILRALHFKLTVPSMQYFLQRYLKAGHADRRMVHLASFICERCLLSYDMLKYLPSTIAASAVYLSRKNCGRNFWSPTLVRYTNYTEESLFSCLRDITTVLESSTTLQAVYKKYSSSKFSNVATMVLEGVHADDG